MKWKSAKLKKVFGSIDFMFCRLLLAIIAAQEKNHPKISG